MLTIDVTTVLKRCKLDDASLKLLEKLKLAKEPTILTLGHKGNWEWAGNAISIQCDQPLYIAYHPLTRTGFNELMLRMRSRFGATLIPMSGFYKFLKQLEGGAIISAFVADQSPPPSTAYWTNFMHQRTAFFKGPERISAKLGFSVAYLSIHRVRRGYYEMKVEMIAKHDEQYVAGQITEKYANILERDISAEPQTWLWSHKRWKHEEQSAN